MMLFGGFKNGFGCFGSLWGTGLFLIVLVVAAFLLFNFTKSINNSSGDTLEMLRIKYANGEIDEEEYLRKKSILEEK